MRQKTTNGELTVQAIAGSNVVLLGFSVDPEHARGLLGFAVERTDHTENERYYMRGFRTFPSTDPAPEVGTSVSTLEHPIQGMYWGDYSAKANHDYTYRVVALYGRPKYLEQRAAAEVRVQTPDPDAETHAVYFNRGVAASQAYARRFNNLHPDQIPNREAYKWLSRGLLEGLLAFIEKAAGRGWSLHGAFYEFRNETVLRALQDAHARGVDVRLVVDMKRNGGAEDEDNPREKNQSAIRTHGLEGLVVPREANSSYIAHNKFLVLSRDGKPAAVWTGSTNLTDGGIYGHSNVGHIVRSEHVAHAFEKYFHELTKDPEARALRRATEELTPVPTASQPGIEVVLSPRRNLDALKFYANLIANARQSVFLTAAFGVNDALEEALTADGNALRYGLLERPDDHMDVLQRDPDNRFSVGSVLKEGILDRWYRERLVPGLNPRVKYIHTKYLLVDPLTSDPVVVTGSANFSNPSTTNNDENMLIITGDTDVADLYLGEFMRLFQHFYFRQFARSGATPRPLDETDRWSRPYFTPGTQRWKEREMFAGL